MLNNEDLKTIEKVVEYLAPLGTHKAIELTTKLIKLHNKIVNNKKEQSKKSNDYNKKNKKYHSLINSLSYHRKNKNYNKVKELEEKLTQIKNM